MDPFVIEERPIVADGLKLGHIGRLQFLAVDMERGMGEALVPGDEGFVQVETSVIEEIDLR